MLRLAPLLLSSLLIALPATLAPTASQAAAEPAVPRLPPIGLAAREKASKLLDELKEAGDTETAQQLEQRIWSAWNSSGDKEIDTLLEEAVALMHMQRFDDALAVLDTIVHKAPDFTEGWNKRATLLFVMHDYAGSLADLAQVIRLEPRHFGAYAGVGLVKLTLGDRQGAIEAYGKVLGIDPQNAAARASVKAIDKVLAGDPA